jgi:hypothetical protein
MKKNRIETMLLGLAIVGSLLGLITTGWRTIDYYTRLHIPLYSLWFFAKTICFMGVLLIGYVVFRLRHLYNQTGYFDEHSCAQVRRIGLLLFGIAVFSSLFNVLRDDVIQPQLGELPPMGELGRRIVWDFLFESPVLLFVSLLTFVFAQFMQQAIGIRRDNESII